MLSAPNELYGDNAMDTKMMQQVSVLQRAATPGSLLKNVCQRWGVVLLLMSFGWMNPVAAQATFDQRHPAWTALLHKHVMLSENGNASSVRYRAFAQDREALRAYLGALSSVTRAEYAGWSRAQQMAFLINAYNAYTVELILTKYPDIESIKDLGGLLSSPWKKKFIPLLGATVSLDGIEHDMLRQRGVFDNPYIHFAVNCASIGCPMLREEAYVAEQLDAQLAHQAKRFMADRSRNRFGNDELEVSKIFDWYGGDFRLGHRGIHSLEAFFAQYAAQLADAPEQQAKIRAHAARITFLDYDWQLNDAKIR